jgi:hypothetical protein
MELVFSNATPEDAPALAALHGAVAERLTLEYGRGHWSSGISEAGVLRGISSTSRVVVARNGKEIIATLRLATKRTWPAEALRLDAYDGPAGAGGFYDRCGFRETVKVTYRGTPLVYFELLL